MIYSIDVFYNTGFNYKNVPYNLDVLKKATTKSFEGLWLLQDKFNLEIRVNSSWDNLKNADYCVINYTAYFITNIEMVNENVCKLFLAQDFIATTGVNNIEVLSGWGTRRCLNNDELYSNNITENFLPSEELQLDIGVKIGDTSGDSYLNLCNATVNVMALKFNADTYLNLEENLSVTVPKLPPIKHQNSTEFYMLTSETSGRHFQIPTTGVFDLSNDLINENLQSLRSLGIEDCITASYKIPTYYVGNTTIINGYYIQLKSSFKNVISNLPYKYTSVKNNKVFTGQFMQYRLYSICSGDSLDYKAEDIYNGDVAPTFITFADLQPTGKPYCRPKYYKTDVDNIFIECVGGAEWQNYQIIFRGQSGQALADLAQNRRRFETTIKAVENVVDMGLSSATKNINGIVSGGKNLLGDIYNLNKSEQDYKIDKNVVVPDIRFPLSTNLQNYYSNCFWISRIRLSLKDTVRFDNFLTQFGYAVSEPFTKDFFTGRVYFNYVQATGVNIKTNNSAIEKQGCINAIENGVRIWHTLPNLTAMYDNPIKGAT